MASTIQSFRYKIEASFLVDSIETKVLTESIQSFIGKYDYETKQMPIIYLSVKLQDFIYDRMVKNIDNGSIILSVYKYMRNDSKISQKQLYFRRTFSYFIPENITYNEKKILNNSTMLEEKDRSYRVYTLGLFDMDIVNKNGTYINKLFKNSDMQSIVHFCTSHMGNILIEPFKDNQKLDFCFVPPNMTINRLLNYLNSVHTFYNTGYRYFNDFNRSYLLSTMGNPIGSNTDEFDTVIIHIMETEEYNTKLLSMEVDRTQNAYIIYIDKDRISLNIDHMNDKKYQKILTIDPFGNKVERELNIPKNENGTEKTRISRSLCSNLDYIDTIKESIENNSIIINIIKSEIDNSILTPNKEYLIKNIGPFKKYNGKYMLAYKKEVLVQESDDYISNTLFGLRKVIE